MKPQSILSKTVNNINRLISKYTPFSSGTFESEIYRSADDVGWNPVGSTLYSEYKNNDYENAFPSVNKIMQGFASDEPFLIDHNGKSVKTSNILDNIYNPNADMSAYDFREAPILMSLIHDEVYLRVHYKGSKTRGYINAERITGFTFLEQVSPTLIDGKRTFHLANSETITGDEVLTLSSPWLGHTD